MNAKNLLIDVEKIIRIYGTDSYKRFLIKLGLWNRNDNLIRVKTKLGRFWLSPKNSSMFWAIEEIIGDNIYHNKINISNNDIILDLGMNIGVYSIYAANRYGAKVIGVEPVSSAYKLALKNVSENGLEKLILPINYAVANRSGDELKIWVDEDNDKLNSAYQDWRSNKKNYELAKTIAFKELLKKFKPTIIKCDIEGGEWKIFFENKDNLARMKKTVRYVVMELHNISENNNNYHDMEEIFIDINYKTQLILNPNASDIALLYAWK